MSWIYKNKIIKSLEDIPEWAEHFVYEITDENGKKYIGKKQILSKRYQEIVKSTYTKLRKEGKEVKRAKNKKKSTKKSIVWRYKKLVIKSNNWENYTGSNVPLNKAIKEGLKIEKEILCFCKTKKQATYYELKYQFINEVIETKNYWNENILSKFFPRDLL